jgi:hypothetical protein
MPKLLCHALKTLMYCKRDCVVSMVLFEVCQQMTPLQIIFQHDFIHVLSFTHGFVIPFPELMFTSCSAIQHVVFLQTNPPIDQALANLQKVQCDPLTNSIKTCHLHQSCELSVENTNNNTWMVDWGPY